MYSLGCSSDIAQIRIHTIHNCSNIEVTDWSEGTIPSAGEQVMVNAVID